MSLRQEFLEDLILQALDRNGVGGCEHGVTAGCIHCRARWSAEAVEAWLSTKKLTGDVLVSEVRERETDYCYIQDGDTPMVRVVFMRAVRRDTIYPADTYTSEDAHVDVDDAGNVIGITAFLSH